MTSLSGLFIEAPHMVPTSPEKLSDTPETWGEEITNKVRAMFPMTISLVVGISFTKKDDETGTAVGNVLIMNQQQNRRAFIPLIVKNFRMCPLDVFLKEDPSNPGKLTASPLTADLLAESLMDNTTWAHLERPDDYFQRIYGQLGALGVGGTMGLPPKFASARSHGLILPSVMPHAYAEQVDAFRQGVMANTSYLGSFEKNGQMVVLKYILQGRYLPQHVKTAAAMPEAAVAYAKNRDNTLIDLISTDGEIFRPQNEVPVQNMCCPVVSGGGSYPQHEGPSRFTLTREHLHDLRTHGETVVEAPERPIIEDVTLVVPQQRTSEGQELDMFHMVCLRTKGGAFTEGVLFPRVIDFDMNGVDLKIFVGPGHSSVAQRFIGDKVCKETMFHITKVPKAGDMGTFVYTTPEGKALALIPTEIISIVNGTYTVRDLAGRSFKVRPFGGGAWGLPEQTGMNGEDVKPTPVGDPRTFKLLRVTRLGETYMLPDEFKFVPLRNLTEMSDLYGLGKYASRASAAPVHIVHTGAGLFAIKGLGLDKTAQDLGWSDHTLTAMQTRFLLASAGMSLEKTAQAVEYARKNISAEVGGLDPRWVSKTASAASAASSASAKRNPWAGADKLAHNLFKEAGFFDDTQLVDNILSLNFINQDNASLYAAQIPQLEESAQVLAQLTLAARLGMNSIPEAASASAMQKIVEVVQGLKSMKGELHNS
jgi:hypothetical protein